MKREVLIKAQELSREIDYITDSIKLLEPILTSRKFNEIILRLYSADSSIKLTDDLKEKMLKLLIKEMKLILKKRQHQFSKL